MTIECGVPQGSIPGPLLFLLYVNDICNVSSIFHFVPFADDTYLFYSHKNISNIFLNSHRVCLINEVGFLGVILDEHLTWKPHISQVARKMSKSIDIIKKVSFYLSKSSLEMLYYALVYPYMQYCILVWDST
jgi:hypothetical protein